MPVPFSTESSSCNVVESSFFFFAMIDDVLDGHKRNPDLDGTRLLTLCSNRVVSVSASSSFILSVRWYDRLFRFLKISVFAAVCSAPIIITHLEALCVLWYTCRCDMPIF